MGEETAKDKVASTAAENKGIADILASKKAKEAAPKEDELTEEQLLKMFTSKDEDIDKKEKSDDIGKKTGEKPKETDKEHQPGGKFDNLEDANKGYSAAEKRMHEATEEAASLRRENAALLKAKEEKKEAPVDPIKEIEDWTAEQLASIVLPSGDDGEETKAYHAKVSKILAEQARRVTSLEQNKEKALVSQEREMRTRVSARLKEENLEAFEDYFYKLAPAIPQNLASLDAAIDWGIGQIKGMTGIVTKRYENKTAEEMEKEAYTPGGPRKAQTTKDEPKTQAEKYSSIGEIIKAKRRGEIK